MQIEEKDGTFSVTHRIIAQVVKEEDEYIMGMIEDYVKEEQRKGNFVSAKIIPEGKLRHIINLGLTRYAAQEHINLKPADMFVQEQYIEYLRRELDICTKENQELKNKINEMEAKQNA